ncbi:MAG: glycosyltransferase family 4 protein [Patescibacteria group bacterium]|jgi:glycosyltransferase involved in cell wall biosynthesis
MKIAFLSFYSGLTFRGAETFVDALALRLAKKHSVSVFQIGKKQADKTYNQYVVESNYREKPINPTGILRKIFLDYHYRHIFTFTLQVLPILNKETPDIVVPVNGSWQTLLVKLFTNISVVVSGQAGLGWDERWNLLCKPDLFIALTNRNAIWVRTVAPQQKVEVIPNGVDLSLYKKTGDKSKKVKLKKPVILCVAGGEKYKRIDATINAAKLLPNASLLVVGGSSETEKYGKRLLGDRFQQLKVSQNQMPGIYRTADVFTLISEANEAFGIAYLEAMATGLAIVAPDDEQRREIIGKAGLYVKEPLNSQDYASKLEKALETKWRSIPRKQAENFDWDTIASQYEKVFSNLLAQK